MFIDNRNETELRSQAGIFGGTDDEVEQFSHGKVGDAEHDCSNCTHLKEAPCRNYQAGKCKGPDFPLWEEA